MTSELRRLAEQRQASIPGGLDDRPLIMGRRSEVGILADMIGLSGELEFARRAGLRVDMTPKPGGDNGVDFYTTVGTIDVKTSRSAGSLIVSRYYTKWAHIYVLAQYHNEHERATLLGWEYGATLRVAPIKMFAGKPCRAIHRNDLRAIEQLIGHLALSARRERVI